MVHVPSQPAQPKRTPSVSPKKPRPRKFGITRLSAKKFDINPEKLFPELGDKEKEFLHRY